MPKLQDRDVERNQVKIEDAALRVFTRQGFHGTTVREIADEAGVSLGAIYTYYPTKEELFRRLVKRQERIMAEVQRTALTPFLGCFEPASLRRLGEAVRRIVYEYPDYWRLMYLDVVEFGNRHFAHTFRDLAANLERLAGGYAGQPHGAMEERGIDRSLAFTAIYLQFFTYFLVEKFFGGKQHLGMPDDRAIAQLVRIFTAGVGTNGAHGHNAESDLQPLPAGQVLEKNQGPITRPAGGPVRKRRNPAPKRRTSPGASRRNQ